MEMNARTSPALKGILMGILVVSLLMGNSYYRIVMKITATRIRGTEIMASKDGLLSVTRCPEQLKICEQRLHSCGEQATGCEILLRQCRRLALTCKKAMDNTKSDLPAGWLKQLTEEWDTRFKGHGLGRKPQNPTGQCGQHGYMGPDATCRCTIMYAGTDCQHGFVLQWVLSTHYDKAYKLQPQKRKFNGEYWGSFILSQQSLMGGSFPGPHNWLGQEMKLALHYRDLKSGESYKDVRKLGRATTGLYNSLPEYDEVGRHVYDQCAVVGSSGVLLNFQQGKEIDRHDMVLRFNGAPVKGFEKHVGSFTTYRLVTTPFLTYNEGGETVLHSPLSAKVLGAYKSRRQFRELAKKAPLYLLDPAFVAWQQGVVLEWQPSVAWTGLMLAMQICRRVDLYGMLVSETEGSPYHYHDTCTSPSSTREKGERDMREWTLLRSFKEMGMLHFMEPCVVECRGSPELCLACRRRAPGWSDTISRELHDIRLRRKTGTSQFCKKSDLHHVVEESVETAEHAPVQVDAEHDGGFDPLMG